MHPSLEDLTGRIEQALSVSSADLLRRDASQFDKGDMAFMIVAGALVAFMIPGLALLYSGLVRRKSALSLFWAVCASNAVVIFQWCLWGYSLAFSRTATNGFIGNLRNFCLQNVLDDPSPGSPFIPELLYSFFQLEAACVTVAILMGAIAERGRVLPAMIFCFVWMTVVYCPLACWAWSPNGWGYKWGVFDFAGGGPVEIGSGFGGLAYSWALGRRREKEIINYRSQNVTMVGLGTFVLWFGWLGFNGGSAYGANLRAVMAVWNSTLAAAFGGMAWCALDYRIAHKFSMISFCSGTVVGLVAATPSCGFITPLGAVAVGTVTGVGSNFATKIKHFVDVDDALDLTAWHGIGGIIGLSANAFLGTRTVISLDGLNTSVPGGVLDSNWKQLHVQFGYICAAASYTFVVTALIAKGIDMIPGLQLRTTEKGETVGTDDADIGEFATDYIEVRRDFADWNPPAEKSCSRDSQITRVPANHPQIQPDAGSDPNSHLRHISLQQMPPRFSCNLLVVNKQLEDGVELTTKPKVEDYDDDYDHGQYK